MKTKIQTLEIEGSFEIIKDPEAKYWKFLHFVDEEKSNVYMDKTIIMALYNYMVELEDPRLEK